MAITINNNKMNPPTLYLDVVRRPPSSPLLNVGIVEWRMEGRKWTIMALTTSNNNKMNPPTLDLVVLKRLPSSPFFNGGVHYYKTWFFQIVQVD
jgi:hypothetical protein